MNQVIAFNKTTDYIEQKPEPIVIQDIQTIKKEYFTQWLEHTKFRTNNNNSVKCYEREIKAFRDFIVNNQILQPTEQDLIRYRESLDSRNLKATTLHNYILVVKMFFKYLEQERLYKNIARDLRGAKISRNFTKDYLHLNQIHTLLESIDRNTIKGKRDYAIILLAITTGLRTIEIARAKIEDLQDGLLWIQGKGRTEKNEYVKVSLQVESAINDYLRTRKYTKQDYLFTSASNHNHNNKMNQKSISRIGKELFRAVGIDSKRCSFHSLRHTSATLNLINGGTIQETQQLLRHKNINTTMIYAHNLERENNKSEQRITDYIFSN